ncbi:hypothetical protein Tco_0001760 [Tanacetum coccineum]
MKEQNARSSYCSSEDRVRRAWYYAFILSGTVDYLMVGIRAVNKSGNTKSYDFTEVLCSTHNSASKECRLIVQTVRSSDKQSRLIYQGTFYYNIKKLVHDTGMRRLN